MSDPDRREYGSHHVGYGTSYAHGDLEVPCGQCKAEVGQPCVRRGGGTHTVRIDRAHNRIFRATHKMAMECENEELSRDPGGWLWSGERNAHPCGVLGPHVLTDCTDPKQGS